ncbi:(2Fe-2S)-binding protein [Actinosynnema sp. NPDC020468]|uniref:(2Fe-2S)-binding protein n=1 Tax=Actinosynnema sp. NPDC020468 TaxID=3154488 RepID=UPI0034031895
MTVPTRAAPRDVPLAVSTGRAAGLAGGLDLRFGLPEDATGWTRCSVLFEEPSRFDAWRAALETWMTGVYGVAPERATAGYVMSWYTSVVGLVGGMQFHLARRVPSLRPADLAIRLADGGRPHVAGVAVLSEEFACLPDDPAAGHPSATAVADEGALAALLRARFAAHAAAFVAAYGPTVRLGRRMLWAAVTDGLDSAAWTAGRLSGDEASGAADAALLLPAKIAPFTSATTLRTENGTWTRRRESCCFHYVLPGAEACGTCPRLC